MDVTADNSDLDLIFVQTDLSAVQCDFSCGATPGLPSEIISLAAIENLGSVNLTWQTASETDNSGFDIQHRVGSDKYETIGFVEGSGTTVEKQEYEFDIEDLDFGTHTFRLKQIDLDGGHSYSDEVEVLFEVPDAVATEGAYPNPFNPSTTLRFAVSVEQTVRATLHDIQGRVVKELGDVQATPHEMQSIQVNGAGLSSGVYLVRLEGDYFATTKRVTLVK